MPKNGFALVVGVGDDLPVTVKDAEAVGDFLKRKDALAFANVKPLVEKNATRAKFLKGLQWLADSAQPGDTVVIYFSGHGVETPDFFFMTNGADSSALESTAVSGLEFALALKEINCKRVIVLLDCCHAGSVEFKSSVKSPLPKKALDSTGIGSGRAIFASSRKGELSWFYPEQPHSEFTKAVLEVLAGSDVSKQDRSVRVLDLFKYVSRVVPDRTDDNQHPILHSLDLEDFVLVEFSDDHNPQKLLGWKLNATKRKKSPSASSHGPETLRHLQRKLRVLQNVVDAYALKVDVPPQLLLEVEILRDRISELEKGLESER